MLTPDPLSYNPSRDFSGAPGPGGPAGLNGPGRGVRAGSVQIDRLGRRAAWRDFSGSIYPQSLGLGWLRRGGCGARGAAGKYFGSCGRSPGTGVYLFRFLPRFVPLGAVRAA